MSENFDLDSDSQRAKRSAELEDAGPRMETSDKESPAYPSSLLAGGKLSGRGNAPVRAALMRQVQRTHGNRAAQRFMQRSAAKSAENDEDISQRIQSKAGSGN